MQLLKTLKWHVWLTLHFYLTARSRENAANILMYFPHCACLQLRSSAPSYKPMCDFSGLIPRQGFPWQPHQESCGPGPRLRTQLGHPSLCRESRSLVSGLLASQALHLFTSLTLVSSCPGLLPWRLGRRSSRHLSWDLCVEWGPCHFSPRGLRTRYTSTLSSPLPHSRVCKAARASFSGPLQHWDQPTSVLIHLGLYQGVISWGKWNRRKLAPSRVQPPAYTITASD